MHRRNSLPVWIVIGIVFVVVASLVLSGIALAQTSASQGSSTPAPAPNTGQGTVPPDQTASPNAAPQTQTPPADQTSPAQAPSGQPPTDHPPAGSQSTAPPAAPPAAQAPALPPAAPATGEMPNATDNGVFVFRKEVDEVTLHATVVDDKNHILTNLDRGAFSVFENDQPQQIKSFRREDYPVAMGIVIDNSGSMREKRDQVNKAALNLVRSSNPQDQVFIVNFNDEYYLDQEFTSDIKKLQAALEKVEARGGTALYDAIVASWTDELAHSPLQRKVIFVVTDGEDDASQLTLEQALHTLQQENGPVVYAIGLLGDEKARKAKRALQAIADRTGGIAFFPPTLGQVDEIN